MRLVFATQVLAPTSVGVAW